MTFFIILCVSKQHFYSVKMYTRYSSSKIVTSMSNNGHSSKCAYRCHAPNFSIYELMCVVSIIFVAS